MGKPDGCADEHCDCQEHNGTIYFEGLQVRRLAVEMFGVKMDTVTWLGCPADGGYLYLPAGYTHRQIRNSVYQFQLGQGVGDKLGYERAKKELREWIGAK